MIIILSVRHCQNSVFCFGFMIIDSCHEFTILETPWISHDIQRCALLLKCPRWEYVTKMKVFRFGKVLVFSFLYFQLFLSYNFPQNALCSLKSFPKNKLFKAFTLLLTLNFSVNFLWHKNNTSGSGRLAAVCHRTLSLSHTTVYPQPPCADPLTSTPRNHV